MEWNEESEAFVAQRPKPSPSLQVQIELIETEHLKFTNLKKLPKKGSVEAFAIADTGCQTTTAGVNILPTLNLSKRDLAATRHGIDGITNTPLDILGVLFLRITVGNMMTMQMVYISPTLDALFLSEKACEDLGMISKSFPSSSIAATTTVDLCSDDIQEDCKCIPRTPAPEPPPEIPFEPKEENIPKLKAWLINRFESSAFNNCHHQELPSMTGKPMDIVFNEEATPFCVHTPIKVPIHWKKDVKAGIDKDVSLGVIEPVPQNSHVEWCARMVVAPKSNGTPRRTVDLQHLSRATLRDTHYTQTPFEIVSTLPKHKMKTILDAKNGYHSLALSDSAKDKTTFITEWGRYRYRRAPQGYHASGDAYTRRFDDITSQFGNVARCVDDSLLWDDSIESSFTHTYDYLKHCSDNGIIFNVDKFVFAKDQCEFAGFELTEDGYRPPKRRIESIQDFPTPESIKDIRAWFGLVTQVAYAFQQSKVMAPFRELLQTKTSKFYWDETLDRVFQESKLKIIDLITEGVKTYEMDRVTCISTDFSKKGLGYIMTQKYCKCQAPYSPVCGNGHWQLVLVGSRFTTPAESRYAPIEGEALAAVYALNQCKYFVMGAPNVILATDHKPLTKILNDRSLETIENPRLLKLKEKTLMFNFEVVHVPGVENLAPDAFSRYPSKTAVDSDEEKDTEVIESSSVLFAKSQASGLPSSCDYETVNAEALHDPESCLLKELIECGFPGIKDELPANIRYFWPMREELYLIGNVIFKGKKMLIPKSLRATILEGLHAGHQGVSSMLMNARERLFWPHLDAEVRQTRMQCSACNVNAPSHPAETPITTPDPETPFEQVATDFCKVGSHSYLIYVDRYSGWIEIAKLTDQTLRSLKRNCLRWFAMFGVPEEIASDGGPPYKSEGFAELLKTWGIKPRHSSAYYPQSNGRAEVAVKTAKRILMNNVDASGEVDNDKVTRALLAHRNTPNRDQKLSPSELLYGRKLRDHLPNKFRKLRSDWRKARMARELKTAQALPDKKFHDLKELAVGDKVFVQNQYGNKPKKWHNAGRVVQTLPYRRYMILMDGSRRVTMRNRKFLRKAPEPIASNALPNIVVPRIVQPSKAVSEDSQLSAQEEPVEPSITQVGPLRRGKPPEGGL